jgi:hypothetical protein
MNDTLSDTTNDAQEMVYQLMGRMPGWKKIKLTCELIETTRKLMQADLRKRFPQASETELHRRYVARVLPHDEVIRAYGFDPEKEGY